MKLFAICNYIFYLFYYQLERKTMVFQMLLHPDSVDRLFGLFVRGGMIEESVWGARVGGITSA